jgi:MFS family permease
VSADAPEAVGPAAPTRWWAGPDGLLLLGATVLYLGYAAPFALLADLQRRAGFADWGLGIVSGAVFAAALVSQLGLARFADRGHSRKLLVSGLVVGSAALLWMAVADDLWQLVASRALLGLGSGAFNVAARRLMVARHPDRPAEMLGRLTGAAIAGFLVGPPLASGLAEVFGLGAPFLVLGLAPLVSMAAVRRLPEPAITRGRDAGSMRGLWRIPGVRSGLFGTAALYLLIGSFDALWSPLLDDKGASRLVIGISLSLYGVPALALAGWGGRVADRFGTARASRWSLAATVPFTVAYGFIDPVWGLVAVGIGQAVVDVVVNPATQATVAVACPPDRLAAGQGLAGAVGQSFAGLASLVAGPLYGAGGAALVFSTTGAAIALFTVAAWWTAPDFVARRGAPGYSQVAR